MLHIIKESIHAAIEREINLLRRDRTKTIVGYSTRTLGAVFDYDMLRSRLSYKNLLSGCVSYIEMMMMTLTRYALLVLIVSSADLNLLQELAFLVVINSFKIVNQNNDINLF